MNKDQKAVLPRYQQIAIGIAKQIAKGKYQNGDKFSSRTAIATQYQVSPETARRAIALLADMRIVQVNPGSGVVVLSQEKAKAFARLHGEVENLNLLKEEILQLLSFQEQQNKVLQKKIHALYEREDLFRLQNPLHPLEITLNDNTLFIGQTLSQIQFWQNTGATVVAIQRKEELLISPGPYSQLLAGDILMVVGDQDVFRRVQLFLYNQLPSFFLTDSTSTIGFLFSFH